MKKCKITVLKRNFDEELAKEYGAETEIINLYDIV